MAKIIEKRTISQTEEGHVILEAGDIITEDIENAKEIESLRKVNGATKRIKKPTEWQSGRPLEYILNNIKKKVSSNRIQKTYGDMDAVLPPKILARRKKLVLDRMKQERSL